MIWHQFETEIDTIVANHFKFYIHLHLAFLYSTHNLCALKTAKPSFFVVDFARLALSISTSTMTKTKSTSSKVKPAKASKNSKASNPSKGTTGSKKDFIFKFICEQHLFGIEEVAKMDVALAAGFKNIRSEGFSKPVKELVSEGLLDKGSQKDFLRLTQHGIDNMPDDLDKNPDPAAANERYIEFLEKKVKGGADKIRRLWEILSDGQAHAINEIAKKLGYSNPRSFGNTKIIASMKEMGLVEGTGSVKFTNKVRL